MTGRWRVSYDTRAGLMTKWLKTALYSAFLDPMRLSIAFVLALLSLFSLPLAAAPIAPEIEAALKDFRTEGTRGWSFVQTTSAAGGKSLVERFDPLKPETSRWTLLKKDGREPTEKEKKEYAEKQTRRTRGDTAPNVKNNLNLETCEMIADEGERARYKFRLKPGGDEDKSAAFMAVTFTLHRPTKTIERVDLANVQPFSPMFTVNVEEARTVITYSLPEGDRPTLLKEVTVRIRGTTMWFKSMNDDMTVSYSDYHYAGKKADH